MSASGWTALAGVGALALALGAALVAGWQLKEARTLRIERAQPYVAIFAEPSAAASWVFDLVIKNFGRTPATDVRVKIEPRLTRAGSNNGVGEVVELPDVIPILVPGQEWRTLWDTQIARKDSALPSSHSASVRFSDAHGKRKYSFDFGLDWDSAARRDVVDVHGLHDAAKALRGIDATLKAWKGRG
ncbi:MAG: hypothetical protein ACHQC8_03470 [Solirubrobacterales bacterium]